MASDVSQQTFPFALPDLPYPYEALEPHIDAQTMRIHHDKHHKTYVDKLNEALEPERTLHSRLNPAEPALSHQRPHSGANCGERETFSSNQTSGYVWLRYGYVTGGPGHCMVTWLRYVSPPYKGGYVRNPYPCPHRLETCQCPAYSRTRPLALS